jgi:hypothetical protein
MVSNVYIRRAISLLVFQRKLTHFRKCAFLQEEDGDFYQNRSLDRFGTNDGGKYTSGPCGS